MNEWRWRSTFRGIACACAVGALAVWVTASSYVSAEGKPIRAMIVVMSAWERPLGVWRGEAEPWVSSHGLTQRLAVPGLSQPLLCGAGGVCLAVVGEGPVASAASQVKAGNDGYRLAIQNVGRVGGVFVKDVLEHWPAWQGGVGGAPEERKGASNKGMQQAGGALIERTAPPAADARRWPDGR